MKKKQKTSTFLEGLYKQYRVVISSEKTFEERLSFKTTKLGVFLTSFLYTSVLITATTALIFFTQLREYVPGYSSLELLKNSTELSFKVDSLEEVISVNNQYYSSIKKVLIGELDTIAFNRDSLLNEINFSVNLKLCSSNLASSDSTSSKNNLVIPTPSSSIG